MCFIAGGAVATPIVPGPADSGRIEPLLPPVMQPSAPPVMPERAPSKTLNAPKGAGEARFVLRDLVIEGATAFTDEALRKVAMRRIGHKVSLAEIYAFANAINDRYQEEGYFLTRVVVPDQRIENGTVCVRVVEGYIESVVLDDKISTESVVKAYLERIRNELPLTIKTLESTLLRLNDLPGVNFRSVLSAAPSGAPGASQLTLIPQIEEGTASIGFDNFGSRYLGPHQLNTKLSASLLPLQQTTLYAQTSVPTRELGYATVRHSVPVAADVTAQIEAGYTHARPGHTIKPLDIDSTSKNFGISLKYQWERQRDTNFATTLSLDARNVDSDIASSVLTREHVRALRVSGAYDMQDAWNGTNVANLTLSQGIAGLGASNAGDANLSRSEAKPDFFKAELSLARTQALDDEWSVVTQVSGQLASGPLYSSEEFGYGGQAAGRAYDTSEIVGDHGVSGMLELRYGGLRDSQPVNLEPYAYYDFGIVINEDSGQSSRDAATSAGAGVRFVTDWGQEGNLGVAVPLTRNALAPLYGGNPQSPRLLLQINQSF